eukprot:m.394966 g.394966  ORF g.394966 m.394966 type:complete len:582 (-) comp21097_c0_seq1:130-1875(-)
MSWRDGPAWGPASSSLSSDSKGSGSWKDGPSWGNTSTYSSSMTMETAEEREARRTLERQKREQDEYDRLAQERQRVQQETVEEMQFRAKMDELEALKMSQEAKIFQDRASKAEYKTENLVTNSRINEELSKLAANNDQELATQNANMLRTEALLSELESEKASRQRIQVLEAQTTSALGMLNPAHPGKAPDHRTVEATAPPAYDSSTTPSNEKGGPYLEPSNASPYTSGIPSAGCVVPNDARGTLQRPDGIKFSMNSPMPTRPVDDPSRGDNVKVALNSSMSTKPGKDAHQAGSGIAISMNKDWGSCRPVDDSHDQHPHKVNVSLSQSISSRPVDDRNVAPNDIHTSNELFQPQEPLADPSFWPTPQDGSRNNVPPRCTSCFDPIAPDAKKGYSGRAVRTDARKIYHAECYCVKASRRCAFCGKPLVKLQHGDALVSGDWGLYRSQAFHVECFQQSAGPRCALCFDVIFANPEKGFSGRWLRCPHDHAKAGELVHEECFRKSLHYGEHRFEANEYEHRPMNLRAATNWHPTMQSMSEKERLLVEQQVLNRSDRVPTNEKEALAAKLQDNARTPSDVPPPYM